MTENETAKVVVALKNALTLLHICHYNATSTKYNGG